MATIFKILLLPSPLTSNISFTLLLFLIVSASTNSNIQNINHLDASSQQQLNYLQELINMHQKMKNSVLQMSQIHEKAKKTLEVVKDQPNLEISVIQTAFKAERKIISSIQDSTNLPVLLKTWECKNLTQKQIDQQNTQIAGIQNVIKDINGTLKDLSRCQRNEQLLYNLNSLNIHIQNLKQEGSNTCDPPKPEPRKIRNISNLQINSNWIYNSTTEAKYLDQISKLKQQFELTLCPESKPFLVGDQCIDCKRTKENTTAPNSASNNKNQTNVETNVQGSTSASTQSSTSKSYYVYDVANKRCTQCPPKSTLVQHKCVVLESKYKIANLKTNQDHQNSTRWVYGDLTPQQYTDEISKVNQTLSIQVCPDSSPFPFQNATKCGNCQDQKIYDLSEKKCIICPQNTQYDISRHKCATIVKLPLLQSNQRWIYGSLTQESYTQKVNVLIASNVVKNCTKDLPFPNVNMTCMSCKEQEIYNLQTKTCIHCQKKEKFNPESHKCEHEIVECAKEKPFWSGTKCLACPQPGIYSQEKMICQCPENMIYSKTLENCVSDSQQFTLLNSYPKVDNFKGEVPQFNPALSTCGQNTPYFNGKQCISCSLPSYFNFITDICESCEQKMRFDTTTKGCIVFIPFNNRFNSYNGPESKNFCCKQNQQDTEHAPDIKTCDIQTPFYDGNQCIQCEKPHKYFNFTSNKCIECPENQTYSIASQICTTRLEDIIYQSNLSPDILNYFGKNDQQKYQFQGNTPILNEDGVFSAKLEDIDVVVITCSINRPFWNGNQCIQCNLPQYFSFETKKCEKCPNQQIFDILSKSCIFPKTTQHQDQNQKEINYVLPQIQTLKAARHKIFLREIDQ